LKLTNESEHMINQIELQIAAQHRAIDKRIDHNQWKVIEAFQKHRVSDFHFAGSTGYGYNDTGRETLDLVYADVFKAEAGFVRPHFASGTHTISTALFGVLRPGDKLLFITGKPYDTLHKVIGKPGDDTGSLYEWGIEYDCADLLADGTVNWDEIEQKLTPNTKVIGIQRSRGYAWRKSFTVDEIGKMIKRVKQIKPDVIVFVDNCYGEFTEEREPTEVGADLVVGSLIKNPGGGLASTGGYIVGKKRYVELAAHRLIAPGIGLDVGAMLGTMRALFQGFYMAPHAVGQALKGSVFAAALFEHLGYDTNPGWRESRSDIIQAIRFAKEEQLTDFVQGIQLAAAVDAHVVPVPWDMPGYDHPVIMAAGTFMQGGSLELSADAPIREPFIAYMQGGLTYSHAKLGVLIALEKLGERIFCH
jgi:cystathionine beta-lyase family protein involved in aluminum resistance